MAKKQNTQVATGEETSVAIDINSKVESLVAQLETAELPEAKAELLEVVEVLLADIAELTEKLEAQKAEADATIAELMEANSKVEAAKPGVIKHKNAAYELTVPKSHQRFNGAMVLVTAEVLAENPALVEHLIETKSSILKPVGE